MATVQIKSVPTEVHRVIRRRAAAAGQSQQEYLLKWLTEFAQTPTLDEVFDTIGQRSGSRVTMEFAVESIRRDRDSRS